MAVPRIEISKDRIAEFCRRWKVERFFLFGSVLSDKFGPQSDVDVMVEFQANEQWSLLDIATMKLELEELFDRRVDLIEESWIKNPIRRKSILENRELLYAA